MALRVSWSIRAAKTGHERADHDPDRPPNRWGAAIAGRLAALVPAIDVEGPRVRFGLAWAAVTTVAVLAGPLTTAMVFAGVALAAAGQATQSWRPPVRGRANRWRDSGRPPGVGASHAGVTPTPVVAIGGAVLCALAGAAGAVAVLAAVAVTVVGALVVERLDTGRPEYRLFGAQTRTTLAIALVIGTAAATPALVRDELGAVPALVLLLTIHVVDASAFVVGSGASNKWEGPVAGAAAAAALGLAVAAAFVPPFRGVTPWLLAAVAAGLAPLGTAAATTLLGRGEAPVPALRRLDAWLLAGPVWAVVARLVLDLR